jgi:hypothetical protein
MRHLLWIQAIGCCLALASCNVSSEVELQPHCHASTHSFATTGQCECEAFADEANFSSSDWNAHTSCGASELPPNTVCCTGFGSVNVCACASPHCSVGVTGECICGASAPTLSSEAEFDTAVTDCNPDSTMDCCTFAGGVCTCTPGHNDQCDTAGGTRVADCTVADASVTCMGATQVASCKDVSYECSTDADCDKTCSDPSCARCLTSGSCLCGTKSGNGCSY